MGLSKGSQTTAMIRQGNVPKRLSGQIIVTPNGFGLQMFSVIFVDTIIVQTGGKYYVKYNKALL